METSLKLGQYIAEYKNKDFKWGQADCNTFIADWVDRTANPGIANEVIGHYSTVKEMLRFAKVKKIKKELEKAGYELVTGNPKTGDILLQKDKTGFYHSSIVMHGYCYTMNEEHGLVKVDLKKQMTVIDEIWRIV
jgi:hypothetical protein